MKRALTTIFSIGLLAFVALSFYVNLVVVPRQNAAAESQPVAQHLDDMQDLRTDHFQKPLCNHPQHMGNPFSAYHPNEDAYYEVETDREAKSAWDYLEYPESLPDINLHELITNAEQVAIDRSALLRADRTGFTRDEYLRLSGKPSLINGIRFGLQKFGMRTLGRLSEGLRLGWKTGHNSGDSLD